ncbi:hypothetical protein AB0F17_14525 [Nonomuraea sp. NPDC026600]|uniref:hypothetical protein n=1 Tax=Nonomuraea sp. NPDC026600 TaxID=3155363 RepID=UPI0033C6BDA0
MTQAQIAGAAMTRFGKFPDSTIRSLAEEAVRDALSDAGLSAADVRAVFFANAAAGVLTGRPKAQYQRPATVEEVLSSWVVSEPLTLLMRSPIGEGAAAIVVCSAERARRLGLPPVRVRGTVLLSGRGAGDRRPRSPSRFMPGRG